MTAIVLQFDAHKKPVVSRVPISVAELSFVRSLKVGRNFWAVEPTGDSSADSLTGRRLALEYLQFVAKGGLPLQWIVGDMWQQKRNGVEMGFFCALGKAAAFGAAMAGPSLPDLLNY